MSGSSCLLNGANGNPVGLTDASDVVFEQRHHCLRSSAGADEIDLNSIRLVDLFCHAEVYTVRAHGYSRGAVLRTIRSVAHCICALYAFQCLLLSPDALRVLLPAISSCHADCPMHAKRLRCHQAKAATSSGCPHHAKPGVSLAAAGCRCDHSAQDGAERSPEAILVAASIVTANPPCIDLPATAAAGPRDLGPEPPLRPPRA